MAQDGCAPRGDSGLRFNPHKLRNRLILLARRPLPQNLRHLRILPFCENV